MDNVKDNMLLSYECTTKLFLIPRKNAFDLVLWPTCCIETAECRCLMHPCVNVPLSPDNHFVQITKNLAHRICPVNKCLITIIIETRPMTQKKSSSFISILTKKTKIKCFLQVCMYACIYVNMYVCMYACTMLEIYPCQCVSVCVSVFNAWQYMKESI